VDCHRVFPSNALCDIEEETVVKSRISESMFFVRTVAKQGTHYMQSVLPSVLRTSYGVSLDGTEGVSVSHY